MVRMIKVGKITSDLGQKEMPERPKEMGAQIQLIQGDAINFFTQAQQIRLEMMLEGEAKNLEEVCHRVTRVLQKGLVSEQELTGLE
jgi:hypothetical protein